MRKIAPLVIVPLTFTGALAVGGAAYADAPVCTFTSTVSGGVTTCVTTTSTSSLSQAQTGINYSDDSDGTYAAQYCVQQSGSDQEGSLYGGYDAQAAQFQMVTTTTTTTTYRGRSTKANASNVSTSTVTAGPTLVDPTVLGAGTVHCYVAGRG